MIDKMATATVRTESHAKHDSPSPSIEMTSTTADGDYVKDDTSDSMSTRDFIRSDEFVTSPIGGGEGSTPSSSALLTVSDEGSADVTSSRMRTSQVLFPEKRRSLVASSNLESLTINKLRFDSLGLYGRKNEIHTLKTCLNRIQKRHSSSDNEIGGSCSGGSNKNETKQQTREFVEIKGYSGTGKSALVSTLRKPVEKLGGLYVDGKFDLLMRDEPLSGILSACSQICGAILELQRSNRAKFEDIRKEISSKLGSELEVILRFIPVLEEVLPLDEVMAAKEVTKTKGQTNEESKNQFNFAFRRFIRVIGSSFKPLVMVSFHHYVVAFQYFNCKIFLSTGGLFCVRFLMTCNGQMLHHWSFWMYLLPTERILTL